LGETLEGPPSTGKELSAENSFSFPFPYLSTLSDVEIIVDRHPTGTSDGFSFRRKATKSQAKVRKRKAVKVNRSLTQMIYLLLGQGGLEELSEVFLMETFVRKLPIEVQVPKHGAEHPTGVGIFLNRPAPVGWKVKEVTELNTSLGNVLQDEIVFMASSRGGGGGREWGIRLRTSGSGLGPGWRGS